LFALQKFLSDSTLDVMYDVTITSALCDFALFGMERMTWYLGAVVVIEVVRYVLYRHHRRPDSLPGGRSTSTVCE
jgi:hypothetical protein